jgi:hypothetical protein
MEHSGPEDQPADEIGAFERGDQRHRRAVAVADEVRGFDLFEEGDGVLGHQLVGDRPVDVGRATVPPAVGPVHPEMGGEPGHVGLEGPRVGEAGVQEHHRRRCVLT